MNELIRQLKQRSGIDFNPDQEGSDLFAQLIVEECVQICEQATEHNKITRDILKEDELAEKMVIHGCITQGEKLAVGIKQHFGIE